MASREDLNRWIITSHRWIPVVVFSAVGAALVLLAIVRGAQGRWSDAGAIVPIAAIMLFGAAGAAWWARRTAEGPGWLRRLPPEIRDDPVRRREVIRTAWQPRAWRWGLLALSIGGIVWSLAYRQWGALIGSVIAAAALAHLQWRISRSAPAPPPD